MPKLITFMNSLAHPIFSHFPSSKKITPDGFTTDFLGSLTANHLRYPKPINANSASTPVVDEEYFEWIDMLTSVQRASDESRSYTMLELGAGYGRWAVRAFLAARSCGCDPITLGLVEAEPAHSSWAVDHLRYNGVPCACYQIHKTALGPGSGESWLFVAKPKGSEGNCAKEWFGQARTDSSAEIILTWTFGTRSADPRTTETEALIAPELQPYYHGREFALLSDGWVMMRTPTKPLSEILRKYDHVDYLDLDLQGEEVTVLSESINELRERVALVHIGTHSNDGERQLRQLFSAEDWQPIWDFPGQGIRETPFGKIEFIDGVQTWRNPRITPSNCLLDG